MEDRKLQHLWTYTHHGGMALIGIILDLMPQNGKRMLQVVIYLVMGWLILLALNPLLRALPMAGFDCLFLGGLFYTVGVVFFALDEKVSYFHGIWHIFVLAGSFSHNAVIPSVAAWRQRPCCRHLRQALSNSVFWV